MDYVEQVLIFQPFAVVAKQVIGRFAAKAYLEIFIADEHGFRASFNNGFEPQLPFLYGREAPVEKEERAYNGQSLQYE